MNQMTRSTDANDVDQSSSSSSSSTHSSSLGDKDGSTLFYGTIMALLVWIGIYLSSPELFRLSGCFVWLSTFYFLTNLYFNNDEQVQRAVFSLFSFSPILLSVYLFDKTRKMDLNTITNDVQLVIQFFCIFGCIAYFSYYWSPFEMYLFLVNDFMKLTFLQRIISIFIAMSIGAFVVILLQNCKSLGTILSSTNKNDDDDVIHDIKDNASLLIKELETIQSLQIEPQKQEKQIEKQCKNQTENENKPKRKRRRRRKKKRID